MKESLNKAIKNAVVMTVDTLLTLFFIFIAIAILSFLHAPLWLMFAVAAFIGILTAKKLDTMRRMFRFLYPK